MCTEEKGGCLLSMRRLLQFNPAKRLTAREALRHPYVAQFHSPADEPSAAGVINIPIDDNTKVPACVSLFGIIWGLLVTCCLRGAHAACDFDEGFTCLVPLVCECICKKHAKMLFTQQLA